MFPNLPSEYALPPQLGREIASEGAPDGGGSSAFLLELGDALLSAQVAQTRPNPKPIDVNSAAFLALLSAKIPVRVAPKTQTPLDPRDIMRALSSAVPGRKSVPDGDGPVAETPSGPFAPFLSALSFVTARPPATEAKAFTPASDSVREVLKSVTISPEKRIPSVQIVSPFKVSGQGPEGQIRPDPVHQLAVAGAAPELPEPKQEVPVGAPENGGTMIAASVQKAGAAVNPVQFGRAENPLSGALPNAKQSQPSETGVALAAEAEPLLHAVQMARTEVKQPNAEKIDAKQPDIPRVFSATGANAQDSASIGRVPEPQPQPLPRGMPQNAPVLDAAPTASQEAGAAPLAPPAAATNTQPLPGERRPDRPEKAVAAKTVAAVAGAAPQAARAANAIVASPQTLPANTNPRRAEAPPAPTPDVNARSLSQAPAAASAAEIKADPAADIAKIDEVPGFDALAQPHHTGKAEMPVAHSPLASPAHTAITELPRGVGLQLAHAASRFPDRPIELTLAPEELGRVRLSFTPADTGLVMSVSADRPETLDLLRRNIDQLAQDFRELGYTNVSFSFHQQQERKADAGPAPQAREQDDIPNARAISAGPTPAPRPASGTSRGLDLRV